MTSSPAKPARPLFITFEGLDGSGKTTHLRLAASWLCELAIPHQVTHEPGGTPLSEEIRQVFLDHRWSRMDGRVELLLVFASRRQHLIEVIDPALARGEHVLCDRFTDSTRAYQGHGRGVDPELIDQVDRLATGGRKPDLTLLFDLPPEMARERGATTRNRRSPDSADRLDSEALSFYRRVSAGFRELAAAEPERFRRIDSSGSREETAAQVRRALAEVLGSGPEVAS